VAARFKKGDFDVSDTVSGSVMPVGSVLFRIPCGWWSDSPAVDHRGDFPDRPLFLGP
jgi:hypothetical protein